MENNYKVVNWRQVTKSNVALASAGTPNPVNIFTALYQDIVDTMPELTNMNVWNITRTSAFGKDELANDIWIFTLTIDYSI